MTIVLVGGGNGYQKVLDYLNNDDTQIWSTASIYPALQSYPISKVFEIHKEEKWGPFRYEALQDRLVLPYKSGRCPNATVVPTNALGQQYGVLFSSTVSWMIAAALDAHATEIVLLGIDMGLTTEYAHQRDGLFFLLGQAKACNITIVIPEDSQINIFGQQYGE